VDTTTPHHSTRQEAVVFAGADMRRRTVIDEEAFVVAADSGYDNALAAGVPVDILIGDMDSVSSEALDHAERNDVDIQRYPADKDETDLELAIDVAVARGATSITILGGEGGQLGHLFGIGLILTNDRWSHVKVVWHVECGELQAAIPSRPVTIDPRYAIVSLLSIGDARGVTTSGLQWSLTNADLATGSTRGLSNRTTHPHATVSVTDGAVLVIMEDTQ
jgi:thiamine pyrophosphokinase